MFKKNFIKLCAQKGESPSSVCVKIGISAAAFSQWTDETIPRKITQQRAADYFGVSVDYLLGKGIASPSGSKENVSFSQKAPLETKKELRNISAVLEGGFRFIPLYESVSAGFGASAQDYIVDYYPCYIPNSAEAEETLCIRVKGDSMYPKIEDGDILQVRKQTSVDNGSIAVVLVDGEEGLVKRVLYGKDWIELQSINPMYPPIRFNGSDVLRVRVIGLVRKIIKDV